MASGEAARASDPSSSRCVGPSFAHCPERKRAGESRAGLFAELADAPPAEVRVDRVRPTDPRAHREVTTGLPAADVRMDRHRVGDPPVCPRGAAGVPVGDVLDGEGADGSPRRAARSPSDSRRPESSRAAPEPVGSPPTDSGRSLGPPPRPARWCPRGRPQGAASTDGWVSRGRRSPPPRTRPAGSGTGPPRSGWCRAAMTRRSPSW